MPPDHRATARDPKARVVVCVVCDWPLEWRAKIGDWWHSLRSGAWIDYLYQRDGGRCWLCYTETPRINATIDHLRPLAHGGPMDPGNLRLACSECNVARGDLPYRQTMEVVHLRADTVKTRALLRSALRQWREQ